MPPRKRIEADVPDGDVPATRLWMRPVNPATLSPNEQMLLNNMEVISSQLSLITNMLLGGQTIQSEAGYVLYAFRVPFERKLIISTEPILHIPGSLSQHSSKMCIPSFKNFSAMLLRISRSRLELKT